MDKIGITNSRPVARKKTSNAVCPNHVAAMVSNSCDRYRP
ncbi:Uncharacterised protein [Mycobacteroides abscessus subsp. abscessus]|nr:Uncharacterised protein [Mycobacteroides abscessus subsp. abscessus]